jgi:hypothetical protein
VDVSISRHDVDHILDDDIVVNNSPNRIYGNHQGKAAHSVVALNMILSISLGCLRP